MLTTLGHDEFCMYLHITLETMPNHTDIAIAWWDFFLRAGPSGNAGSFAQSSKLLCIFRLRIRACDVPLYANGLG